MRSDEGDGHNGDVDQSTRKSDSEKDNNDDEESEKSEEEEEEGRVSSGSGGGDLNALSPQGLMKSARSIFRGYVVQKLMATNQQSTQSTYILIQHVFNLSMIKQLIII